MKILKHGTHWIFECPQCGCVFNCSIDEATVKSYTTDIKVECPECAKEVIFSAPKHWRPLIRSKADQMEDAECAAFLQRQQDMEGEENGSEY